MKKIKKYQSPSGSLPNIFQRPDGSYFYSNNGEVEVNVTPLNKLTNNPAEWTYTDETGRIYTPKKEYKNTYTLTESNPTADYHNYLNLKDKSNRDRTMAKAYLENGNLYDAFMSYMGMRAPKNPFVITGEPTILPGRATPQQVQQSAKLMETINNYWKNLGRLKVRLSGGRATSGILTKPGTAPTTFNGQNISYITSPKGGNVTHKFYTDQGSEYILTKDGFARRVKSPHNNTLGQGSGPTEWNAANSDAGLHNWNEGTTIFTEGEDGKLFNTAFYKLSDFGFKPGTYGLARKGEKAKIMLIDPKTKQWRAAMLSDVYPTTVKQGLQADRVMETNYSDVPKLGWHILEKANGGWHPGSPVAFIEGLKQGGKMNTLQFLKNGSGIHIKKKNRGKFTDYCGGQVTQECINKGKHSSNPAIRKRATFADNARKWKHKNGGKAFVEGVNVLDSNPKAYKYVKKKYKMRMAQNGTKVDWNSVANVGVNLLQSVIKNKQISEGAKAAKAANKLTGRDFFNIYNQRLQEAKQQEEWQAKTTPGTTINSSNIVAANRAWKNASGDYAALKNNVDQQNKIIDAQAQAQKSDVWGNAISNVMQQGMGMLNNYLSNKSNTTTPNISFNKKIDFGNIKTNFGQLGTYSTNSGYQPKQLSFDWSKVGIQ